MAQAPATSPFAAGPHSIGRCTRVTSQWFDRSLVTLVTVAVDDTLKGGAATELVTEPEDLEEAIDEDGVSHFFLVLELRASFGGLFELPPLIGLDSGQAAGLLGRSYVSDDGGATFAQVPDVNFMFRLIFG